MKMKFFAGLLLAAILCLLPLSQAGALPLDLLTFTPETGATITLGGA